MKTILIDIDDTLNNLFDTWIKLYNSLSGDKLDPHNVIEWDVRTFVLPEWKDKIYDLLSTPGLFLNQIPKPDSQFVTEVLCRHYNVYIVTHCNLPENCVEKYHWIEKHYPHINIENYITCKDKFLLRGDFMVDDGIHNIEKFDGTRVLFNCAHNLFQPTPEDALRVNTWEDVFQVFAYDNPDVLEEFNTWYVQKNTDTTLSDMLNNTEEEGGWDDIVNKLKNLGDIFNKFL